LHNKDFNLLARAIAEAHRSAEDSGRAGSIAQVQQVALTITVAISHEHRSFDPVKFMVAACDVTAFGELEPATRAGMIRWTGATTPRPRLNTGPRPRSLRLDEEINTKGWTEDTGVDSAMYAVSDSIGVAAATSALMAYKRVTTLGQLVAMSDDDLRAVPGLRLGPVTLGAIHKVQELWRAKQGSTPDPETVEVQPSAAMQTYTARLAARAEQLDYPGVGLAAGLAPSPGGSGRSRGRPTPQPPPGRAPGR
jgi:hypothetical protein